MLAPGHCNSPDSTLRQELVFELQLIRGHGSDGDGYGTHDEGPHRTDNLRSYCSYHSNHRRILLCSHVHIQHPIRHIYCQVHSHPNSLHRILRMSNFQQAYERSPCEVSEDDDDGSDDDVVSQPDELLVREQLGLEHTRAAC